MHERLAVYVPNADAPAKIAAQTTAIDAGSGIVGRKFIEDDPESPILIHYEGNRTGALNMSTFADRVYHAASRMTEDYPTSATRVVQPEAVRQVGWFYPREQRVEVEDGLGLVKLAKWLGLYDGRVHTDELHAQMVETRATPARVRGCRVHLTPQDRLRLRKTGEVILPDEGRP